MKRHIEPRTFLRAPCWRGRNTGAERIAAALALILALVLAAPFAGIPDLARAQENIALPPTAPGLAAPTDGATIQDAWGEVILQWQEVPGALEYQVLLNGGERTGPWIADTTWSPGSPMIRRACTRRCFTRIACGRGPRSRSSPSISTAPSCTSSRDAASPKAKRRRPPNTRGPR